MPYSMIMISSRMSEMVKFTIIWLMLLSPLYVHSQTFTGTATYYSPSVGIGACGWSNTDQEFVAAVSSNVYGSTANPNDAPVCGKFAVVQTADLSRSVRVKVVDRCPGCALQSIDLSPAAFDQLAEETIGIINVVWTIEDTSTSQTAAITTLKTTQPTPSTTKLATTTKSSAVTTAGVPDVTMILAGAERVCDSSFCVANGGPGQYSLGTCLTTFCKCGGGSVSFTQQCAPPLVYDKDNSVCNWRSAVPSCI